LAIACVPSMATAGIEGVYNVDRYTRQYSDGTTVDSTSMGNFHGSLVLAGGVIQSTLVGDYQGVHFWLTELGAYTDYGNQIRYTSYIDGTTSSVRYTISGDKVTATGSDRDEYGSFSYRLELTKKHDVAQPGGTVGDSQDRFDVSDDGSVLDTVTGIRWWLNTPLVTRTWSEAKAYCASLATPGGYDDWGLPEEDMLIELRSDGAGIFRFRPAGYWSRTAYGIDTARVVDFNQNTYIVGFSESRESKHYVVCAAIPQHIQTTMFDPNGNHKVDIGDVIVHLRFLAKQRD